MENTIFILVGLLANAFYCYGLPRDFCSSNVNSEAENLPCDEESPSGINWYKSSVNEELPLRRNIRDIDAIQYHPWQNVHYRQYISEPSSLTDQSYYPSETCRATRQSIKTSFSPTVLETDEPRMLRENSEVIQIPQSNVAAYGRYLPANPQISVSRQMETPYSTYTDPYYYSQPLRQDYEPIQFVRRHVTYSDASSAEEDDDETVPGFSVEPSPAGYYDHYNPSNPSSRKNMKKYNSELDDVMKKSTTLASQQRNKKNTLVVERQLESPNSRYNSKILQQHSKNPTEQSSSTIGDYSVENENVKNVWGANEWGNPAGHNGENREKVKEKRFAQELKEMTIKKIADAKTEEGKVDETNKKTKHMEAKDMKKEEKKVEEKNKEIKSQIKKSVTMKLSN